MWSVAPVSMIQVLKWIEVSGIWWKEKIDGYIPNRDEDVEASDTKVATFRVNELKDAWSKEFWVVEMLTAGNNV